MLPRSRTVTPSRVAAGLSRSDSYRSARARAADVGPAVLGDPRGGVLEPLDQVADDPADGVLGGVRVVADGVLDPAAEGVVLEERLLGAEDVAQGGADSQGHHPAGLAGL